MSDVQEWTHEPRATLDGSLFGEDGPAAPDGPWWQEPDKRQWVDPATDMDCLMVRNHHGVWCGYVAVDETHPLFGKDYGTFDADVHGGLTFADFCQEDAPEGHGICHIPLPGRPDRVWWFGFDCGHAFDYSPGMAARMPDLYKLDVDEHSPFHYVYRDVSYVQGECEDLAKQLRALA